MCQKLTYAAPGGSAGGLFSHFTFITRFGVLKIKNIRKIEADVECDAGGEREGRMN